MRILFTSVGRRVTYLRQVRDAAQRLGIVPHFVGTDIDELAPALNEVDVAVLAPRSTADGYDDFLLEACARHEIDLVVPLTDPDARLLADRRSGFEAAGLVVAAVSPSAAEVIDDKWRTVEYFAECGVSSPQSWLEVPNAEPSKQLLIKPRRGSAGQGIVPITTGYDGVIPKGAFVQEVVRGSEVTIDAFCMPDGSCASVAMRERLEIRAGEVSKARTVFHEDVEEDVLRIVPGLGAIGPITLQCFLTETGPQFIEINGRAGGGIPLSIHAGSRSDELLFQLRNGGSTVYRPAVDIYMTRYDDQFFSQGKPTPFEVPLS